LDQEKSGNPGSCHSSVWKGEKNVVSDISSHSTDMHVKGRRWVPVIDGGPFKPCRTRERSSCQN
jgi:hypothetical protein